MSIRVVFTVMVLQIGNLGMASQLVRHISKRALAVRLLCSPSSPTGRTSTKKKFSLCNAPQKRFMSTSDQFFDCSVSDVHCAEKKTIESKRQKGDALATMVSKASGDAGEGMLVGAAGKALYDGLAPWRKLLYRENVRVDTVLDAVTQTFSDGAGGVMLGGAVGFCVIWPISFSARIIMFSLDYVSLKYLQKPKKEILCSKENPFKSAKRLKPRKSGTVKAHLQSA